jgi:Uma2 family endonuclease
MGFQVMTPPTRRHQRIVDAVNAALRALCPDQLVIVREQEVRIGEVHRRNPDVMAAQAAADDLDIYGCEPHDVVLAVEAVSPTTQTIDRLHKPAEYAAAGIEHYWRVEIIPQVAVHTHRLADTGSYVKSGVFTEGDSINAPGLPWAKIAVNDLAP